MKTMASVNMRQMIRKQNKFKNNTKHYCDPVDYVQTILLHVALDYSD